MNNLLGEKIEELRLKKGITLSELAKKANISYVQLRSIKNGKCKPQPITLNNIAKALDVSYEDLNLFA